MSFDSPLYIFFLSIFLTTYILFAAKQTRQLLLIAGGIFFLAQANSQSAIILSVFALVSYGFAQLIANSRAHRKLIFALAILVNFGALIAFRIYQNEIPGGFFPFGFSFFCFASLTYLRDAYSTRVRVKPAEYLSALMFFPTLASGPIYRVTDLIRQIKEAPSLNWQRARFSVVLIANGFFKKAVSELIATAISSDLMPHDSAGFAWLRVVLFTAKYYADFSGYSDIAIGSAGLLGINIPLNFNLPFLATSIGEFWRRWHMSLNHWMTEYVFKPLIYTDAFAFLNKIPAAGSVLFLKRQYPAAFIAMLGMGLWHGLNLNFALWGAYMGILLCLEMAFAYKWKDKLPIGLQIFVTFFLVLNSFAIFMNPDLNSIGRLFAHMYGFGNSGLTAVGFSYIVVVGLMLLVPHLIDYILIKNEYFQRRPFFALYTCITLLALHFLMDGFNGAPFEYFKF